jgi:hypothetical protein
MLVPSDPRLKRQKNKVDCWKGISETTDSLKKAIEASSEPGIFSALIGILRSSLLSFKGELKNRL